MNFQKLKNLVKDAGGLNPHATIEANKGFNNLESPQRVQQPVQLPQRVQQPVQPPQRVQQPVQPPQRVQQPVQPPQRVQQSVQPPQRVQQPVQPPQRVQQPVQPPQRVRIVNEAPKLNIGVTQRVAQKEKQKVAQERTQAVAQAVAQGSWVAQDRPQTVAQDMAQKVAQERPQKMSHSSLLEKDIEGFKEQIYLMDTIEERKLFISQIGFGLSVEKRNKQFYFYGIKKLEGKKYRLYIGNVKS